MIIRNRKTRGRYNHTDLRAKWLRETEEYLGLYLGESPDGTAILPQQGNAADEAEKLQTRLEN